MEATDGAARAGILHTAHGSIRTPAFMPVGTKGTVKTLHPAEVRELGAEVVLGNTYHLHFRPGEDVIADLGGLQPGTRYYYRVGARSDAGTTVGNTRSFTTSAGPLAATGPAQVSGVNVVLTGTVDPVGRSTTWWFELGPTTAYATATL